MRHVGHIASRELHSLFVSPVAYVVLALWAVLAGFFFLSAVSSFGLELMRMQQFGAFDQLSEMNLNDHLFLPFLGSMWIVLVFAIPAVSMGLLAAEKANGTQELLLTTPLSIWEIVLGKYLAGACFAFLMVAVVGCFAGLLWHRLAGLVAVPFSRLSSLVSGNGFLLGSLLVLGHLYNVVRKESSLAFSDWPPARPSTLQPRI